MATDYAALVKPSDGLVPTSRGREAGPNPLAGFVSRTANDGPLMIPVTNEEQAKEVTNYLRRDAKDSDLGLSLQYKNGRGEKVEIAKAKQVHFVGKEKSERAYTADDIRAYHGYPTARKLTEADRIEYRLAAKLDSKKDRERYVELGGNLDEFLAGVGE